MFISVVSSLNDPAVDMLIDLNPITEQQCNGILLNHHCRTLGEQSKEEFQVLEVDCMLNQHDNGVVSLLHAAWDAVEMHGMGQG